MLGRVVGAGGEFDSNDSFEEEELHMRDQQAHGQWQTQGAAGRGGVKGRLCGWVADHFASLTSGTWLERRDTRAKSSFKVLRFHFMARNELLGQAKFKWAMYLSMTTAQRIEDMISIEIRSWAALIVLIVVLGTPLQLAMTDALLVFLAFGWLLLLAESLMLLYTENTLDWLVVRGHEHRRAAELLHERALARKSDGGGARVLSTASRWGEHGASVLARLRVVL